jgi:hypothetical protein
MDPFIPDSLTLDEATLSIPYLAKNRCRFKIMTEFPRRIATFYSGFPCVFVCVHNVWKVVTKGIGEEIVSESTVVVI